MAGFFRSLRLAFGQAMGNNVFDTAKAAAYSGMLMIFPTFLVLTTLLALVPETNSILDELRTASEQFLPADTMSLLQSYFHNQRSFSLQVLLSATFLSVVAAWGVMSTLMEGFRRAYRLPRKLSRRRAVSNGAWGFWQRRTRALLLVPIALLPLSLATLLLVFGRPIEFWMIDHSQQELRTAIIILWRLVRWSLALVTSTTVLGAVYHYGTNSREKWTCVAPGAITATLLWFPTTLAFGVYVTRLADYTVIYGSLGTAIATLVWLYLTSFSILLGAQLNGVLYRGRRQVATAARVAAYRDAVNSSIAAGQSSTSHAGISIAGTNHAGTPTSEQTVSPISGSV